MQNRALATLIPVHSARTMLSSFLPFGPKMLLPTDTVHNDRLNVWIEYLLQGSLISLLLIMSLVITLQFHLCAAQPIIIQCVPVMFDFENCLFTCI